MKTGALSSYTLDGIWCTISPNHPCICWHPCQSINECMGEVDTPLYKQPSNGITSILATQHPHDIPLVDRWKLGHFHPLPWMMCDIQWSPIVNIDIDTSLNSSMDACVRLIHHNTGKQTRGSHPYWSYTPKNVPWVDGWKLGHFHPLHWMVCDIPWAPTIHTGVDTPYQSFLWTCVRLIHHYISKQTRGLYPFWPHNTQRMDEHGGKKTDTFSASAFADGVWCTMSSNYMYRFWHPSQTINGYMDEADTPLHKQPNNGITSIPATQNQNDIPWVDGWKLRHFLLLPWMVCDLQWAPTIDTSVDTSINPSMDACVRLGYHCTRNQAKGYILTGHTTPKWCTMGRWMKTGALSSSALDGVWCTMSSNLPIHVLTALSIHQWMHG